MGKSAIIFILALALGGMLAMGFRPSVRPDVRKGNGLYPVKNASKHSDKTEIASFAAGCFWGVEDQFRHVKGVIATAVGFSGGHVPNPSYKRVCVGDTGHAETVTVQYDPSVISYSQLLDVFWAIHDPTTPDQQGPDIGEQYRSVIFYHSPEQKKEALASIAKLQKSGEFKDKVVTEIVPAGPFYYAEDYHQQYVEKGGIALCHVRKKVPFQGKE